MMHFSSLVFYTRHLCVAFRLLICAPGGRWLEHKTWEIQFLQFTVYLLKNSTHFAALFRRWLASAPLALSLALLRMAHFAGA